jgi:hypothetical protein
MLGLTSDRFHAANLLRRDVMVGAATCGRFRAGIEGQGRIFVGWRQLSNAIAAPSTDALKRSSWYRIRVTRSARSVGLR